MRLAVLVLVVAACSHEAPTAATPAAPLIAAPARPARPARCGEAAVGLEHATRSMREPGTSIVREMDGRCQDDGWPAEAVGCFARMGDDDLPRCAHLLPAAARDAMFALVAGGGGRAAIEVARLRLDGLEVGVGECDRFVAAVATVLGCEQIPIDARIQLGNQTVDFWNLPTSGLSLDAQRRMAEVCGASLAELQQRATGAGCTL